MGPASRLLWTSFLVVGCTGPSKTTSTGTTSTGTTSSTGSGVGGSGGGKGSRCVANSMPSTTSFALASWPALAAITATDLSAQAAVTSAPVPGAPAGVLVTKDGNWVVTAVAGNPGQLALLHRTGTALTADHTIAMPANETPFGLAASPDGTMLAVSLSDEVALFDLAKVEANAPNALIALVPTQSVMRTTIDVAFSKDGHFAFAALEYDRAVAVIDVVKRAYVGAIPIAGNAVTGVVVSSDGSHLYVINEVADEFIAANPKPATDQVVGSVTVVDAVAATTAPATSVLGHAFVGRAPVRATLSPDGASLWVSVRGSNAVIELDAANLLSTTCEPRLETIAVGHAPVGLAFTGTNRLAVANSNRFLAPNMNQNVMLIDTGGGTVLGQVGVGAFPRELDADKAAMFVSNYNSSSIDGIDLTKLP